MTEAAQCGAALMKRLNPGCCAPGVFGLARSDIWKGRRYNVKLKNIGASSAKQTSNLNIPKTTRSDFYSQNTGSLIFSKIASLNMLSFCTSAVCRKDAHKSPPTPAGSIFRAAPAGNNRLQQNCRSIIQSANHRGPSLTFVLTNLQLPVWSWPERLPLVAASICAVKQLDWRKKRLRTLNNVSALGFLLPSVWRSGQSCRI